MGIKIKIKKPRITIGGSIGRALQDITNTVKDVASDISKPVMKGIETTADFVSFGSTTGSTKDLFTGKVINNALNVLEKGADDTLQQAKKSGADVGNAGAKAANVYYQSTLGVGIDLISSIDKGLLNNNLNMYSGGFIDSLKNATDVFSDISDGKAVDDNLKSIGRVAAVAGAAIASGGTAAIGTTLTTANIENQSWGQAISNMASSLPIPGPIKEIFNNIVNPPQYYADSNAGTVFIQDAKKNFLPIIIISTVLIGGVIIITAKNKRKK